MVELKHHQQQEMEGKLQFHSRLMLMAGVQRFWFLAEFISIQAHERNDPVMSGSQLFFFHLIPDDTGALDCVLNGCCNLLCTALCWGSVPQKLIVSQRKSPRHFLRCDSLWFFSYFFLLPLFVPSSEPPISGASQQYQLHHRCLTLASGHPGVEIKILYSMWYCTVKYTKAQPLVEDAHA